MKQSIHDPGFAPPVERERGHERLSAAVAELVASAALALSTLAVATVVSIGMARANPAGAIIDNEGGLFAVALLLGLVFAGMGGITLLMLSAGRPPRR